MSLLWLTICPSGLDSCACHLTEAWESMFPNFEPSAFWAVPGALWILNTFGSLWQIRDDWGTCNYWSWAPVAKRRNSRPRHTAFAITFRSWRLGLLNTEMVFPPSRRFKRILELHYITVRIQPKYRTLRAPASLLQQSPFMKRVQFCSAIGDVNVKKVLHRTMS